MAAESLPKRAVQGFLWLLIVCSMACFVIITFMRPTTWYSQNDDVVDERACDGVDEMMTDGTGLEGRFFSGTINNRLRTIRDNMTMEFPGDVPVLTEVVVQKGKEVTRNVGRNSPLWSGSNVFPNVLQWGSLLVAALATAGLQQLSRTSGGHASGPAVTTTLTGLGAATRAFWRKLRRVAATQVYPIRFWNWFCGGLSVMDAFLVMLYIGCTLVYLWYYIEPKFERISQRLTPPPAKPVKPGKEQEGPEGRQVDLMTPLFGIQRLEAVAKAWGELLRFSMMIMFVPISRSNFLKWVFGTDYATIIKYHMWMSWGTIWMVIIHSALYMIEWGAEANFIHEFSWERTQGRQNVVGLVSTLAACVIGITSMGWFRSNYFRWFYRLHIGGMLVFIIFGMMHWKGYVNWIGPGLVLYAIDRGFRFWQLSTNWTRVGPENVSIDGSVLTLQLKWQQADGKTIATGQEVYLRCPAISFTASHPFSSSDVKQLDDGTTLLTVHMACVGPWTKALKNKIQGGCRLLMQVEGPYDTSLDHLTTTPVVVMIAGGVGVTPCLCLLRRFLRQHLAFLSLDVKHTDIAPAPKVYFVWSARRLSELKLMGEDMLAACTAGIARGKSSSTKLPDTDASTKRADSSSSEDLASTSSQSTFTNGWLQAALHYTGFELEQRQNSVEVQMPLICGLAAAARAGPKRTGSDSFRKDDGSSPSGSHINTPPRLLAAHPASNPALYAICVLFGFFGAWAGLLLAAYYDAFWARTTREGADYLAVCFVQWLAVAAGGIISPLMVLCVHWTIMRLIRSRQATSPPELDGAPSLNSRSNSMSKAPGSYLHNTLTVLPGYVLAPLAAKATGEGGISLGRGRPNLSAVLEEVVRQHPDVAEIEVLVAGGDSLAEPIRSLCSQHNLSRGKGPALLMKRVAHHN